MKHILMLSALVLLAYQIYLFRKPPTPVRQTAPLLESHLEPRSEFDHLHNQTPVLEPTDDIPIASAAALRDLEQIEQRVSTDLAKGQFGASTTMSFNVMFLFRQSLGAFVQYLSHSNSGPDFHILFHRDFSGRYNFHSEEILMGQPTLENGEGRFLVTLFHEYQHYLYHSIYGTPEFTDIVTKFYNELAAHTFEALLTYYLPNSYFEKRHRGGFPEFIYRKIISQQPQAVISACYDLMLPPEGHSLFYTFLKPAQAGYIRKEEITEAFDSTFHPIESQVKELAEISERYFKNNPIHSP